MASIDNDCAARPLDLTFGIEIECLILRSTDADIIPCPTSDRFDVDNLVHEGLSKPIQVRCATCNAYCDFVPDLNPTGRATERDDPEYTRWTVGTDISIALGEADADAFPDMKKLVRQFPVEITSRVLSLTKNLSLKDKSCPEHTHEITADVEIDAVYRSLERHFNSQTSDKNIRLVIQACSHRQCPAWIHIGNALHGFPLATVKNILSLCIAREQLIDKLHSTSRINGSTLLSAKKSWAELNHNSQWINHVTSNVYNMPWSSLLAHAALQHSDARGRNPAPYSVSRHAFPGSQFETHPHLKATVQRFDLPSWLELIAAAEDIGDLKNLQEYTAKRSIINFHNLLDYRPGEVDSIDIGYKTMTIEFRQHAGTLQSQETLSWLRVLSKLVQFAHRTTEDDVKKLCLKNWAYTNFTSIDFLELIGVDTETVRHYELVQGMSGPQSYADLIQQTEHNAALAVPWHDTLSLIALYLISKRTESFDPGNVNATIQDKLVRGGYGQFPAGYFAGVALPEGMKEILTVGTRPPWAQRASSHYAIGARPLPFRPPLSGADVRTVYEEFGIQDVLVIVRTDQGVAWVGAASGFTSLRRWLRRSMFLAEDD